MIPATFLSPTFVSFCVRNQCKMYVHFIVWLLSTVCLSVSLSSLWEALSYLFSIFCIMLCCCHHMFIIFREWNEEGGGKQKDIPPPPCPPLPRTLFRGAKPWRNWRRQEDMHLFIYSCKAAEQRQDITNRGRSSLLPQARCTSSLNYSFSLERHRNNVLMRPV